MNSVFCHCQKTLYFEHFTFDKGTALASGKIIDLAMTDTSDLPPQLKSLLLLDAYSKQHFLGEVEQKKCLWNLQKARRFAMRECLVNTKAFSVESVREDIYPRAIVTAEEFVDIPDIEKEDEKKDRPKSSKLHWTLVDPIASEKSKIKHDTNNNHINNSDTGMCHRKGKPNESISLSSKKWIEEDVFEEEETEEDLVRKANPITLFGALPPRDLRLSQANANAAIQAYVDAANIAVQILKLTTDETNKE
jgi:hypothetical protein